MLRHGQESVRTQDASLQELWQMNNSTTKTDGFITLNINWGQYRYMCR